MSDEYSKDADKKVQQAKERRKLQKRELKLRERLEDARSSQMAALERFRSAELRLQKRIGRVNKLEKRLREVQTLLHGESEVQEKDAGSPIHLPLRIMNEQELLGQPDPHVRDASALQTFEDDTNVPALVQDAAALSPVEMADLLRHARAAADAAEGSARLAAARAQAVAANLELSSASRHLSPTLSELEETAVQARLLATDAGLVADEATRFFQQAFEALPLLDTPDEAQPPLFILPEFDTDVDDEEELVSALASMMIAEATATAAAHAEVVAEEKSAQMDQARRQLDKAEQHLRKIRAAITNRELQGEEAELALQEAETIVAHAAQTLADAEKIANLARRSAMNVATSAMVREDMAHVALEQNELADFILDGIDDLE